MTRYLRCFDGLRPGGILPGRFDYAAESFFVAVKYRYLESNAYNGNRGCLTQLRV